MHLFPPLFHTSIKLRSPLPHPPPALRGTDKGGTAPQEKVIIIIIVKVYIKKCVGKKKRGQKKKA
ncbi:hypothetical protein, unlikely [Trypanosoma brucei brucei TREU927]|uniref:Uncharacterized protein n=1 Tax=Trypanosoma brucei brucei (strain 927/4 GUTat10.1) TaxID=185431 RepID=Q38EY8_TRYB2|nr:hypothetical protein, unlikely [Trypanosoma brucei brucei TREU927]EAN76632.1 hypothetical protein, unlikely [Trypanosoma brucei brucei TREU927]